MKGYINTTLTTHKKLFPGGSDGKEFACNGETWVRSLGWKDLLEEDMATYSSIPTWGIPMDRHVCQATVHKESDSTKNTQHIRPQGF